MTEVAEQPTFVLEPPRKAVKRGLTAGDIVALSGFPKCGKTRLMASIPDCVLLELEPGGADRVDGWVQNIANLAMFKAAFKACRDNPQVKAIAVDTLDVLVEWIAADVARSYGLSGIMDRRDGVNGFAVWDAFYARLDLLVATFRASGKLGVWGAHYRAPKLDDAGKPITSPTLSLIGQAGARICAQVDLVGHCFARPIGAEVEYVVQFQPGTQGVFGSRVDELNNKLIKIPKENGWAAIVAALSPTPAAAAPAPAPASEPAPQKEAAPAARRK